MTYSKPAVNTLGEATTVIEFQGKVGAPTLDPPKNRVSIPAYDLDE